MFGPRYFGPRFFGPRYWGVGGAVVVPSATNLIQAIAAHWVAAGLNTAIGLIYQNRVPTGSEGQTPNCIVKVTRGTACLLTSTSSIYNYSVSFRIRDESDVAAHENAVLAHAAFDQVGLEWATGFAAKLTQEDWPSGAEPKLSAGSKQIYWDEIRFLTRVKGTR